METKLSREHIRKICEEYGIKMQPFLPEGYEGYEGYSDLLILGEGIRYEDPTSEVTHGVVTKVDLDKKEIHISTVKVKNPKE